MNKDTIDILERFDRERTVERLRAWADFLGVMERLPRNKTGDVIHIPIFPRLK